MCRPGRRGKWGNGDGFLIYPGKSKQPLKKFNPNNKPLVSIRLELIRDGLEDLEYFHILKGLQVKIAKLPHSDKQEKIQKKIKEALIVPENLAFSLVNYTKDPQIVKRRRKFLADTIEEAQSLIKK